MSYPTQLSQGWSKLAEEIDAEIARARRKFPGANLLTTALTEEHGEAVRAVLEHYYAISASDGSKPLAKDVRDSIQKHRSAVRKELIQTAAMCVRLALEGDPIHLLSPEVE